MSEDNVFDVFENVWGEKGYPYYDLDKAIKACKEYAKQEAIGFAEWKDEKYRQLSNGLFWECTEENRKKSVNDLTLYSYTQLYEQYIQSKQQ